MRVDSGIKPRDIRRYKARCSPGSRIGLGKRTPCLLKEAPKIGEGSFYHQSRWPVLQVWQSPSQSEQNASLMNQRTGQRGARCVGSVSSYVLRTALWVRPTWRRQTKPQTDRGALTGGTFDAGLPSTGSVRAYPLPLFHHILSSRSVSGAAGEKEKRPL